MELGLFLNIITVLEIIIVEFTSIWELSRRKHNFLTAAGTYAAVTIPLLLFMCLVAVNLPGYGNGSGGFMILGAFYFIPAMLNYGGDKKTRIIIAFYSFSYGLAIFGIAVRIGYLFGTDVLSAAVLIAQTLLYLISFPVYIHFSKEKVIPYIQKANCSQKNMLIRYTIASFILIIVYNNIMVVDSPMWKKLVVYLLLIYFIILTYRLGVSYLKADDDKHELNQLACTDRLTKLGNRLALRRGLEKLQSEKESFYLLFLDLNDFKSVNDKYGHVVGDEYLSAFAEELRRCVGTEEGCYRLAGDEFVCLTKERGLCEKIKKISFANLGDIEFLGVSVGIAMYPEEAGSIPELLELADKRMYEQKKAAKSGDGRKKRSI